MLVDECNGSWMWNVSDEVVNLIVNQSMDDSVMQQSLKTICSRVKWVSVYEWSTWMEWKWINIHEWWMSKSNCQRVKDTCTNLYASKNKLKQARALPVVYREYTKIRQCTSGRRAFANTLQTQCKQIMMEPVWFPKRLKDDNIHNG